MLFLITLGIAVVSLPILWFSVLEKVFEEYQINRILSFLNPDAYAISTDYQGTHGYSLHRLWNADGVGLQLKRRLCMFQRHLLTPLLL